MHTAKVVAKKKLSSSQFSLLIRCCDDPETDHWHTVAVMDPEGQPIDKAQRNAGIEMHKTYVATQHELMQDAEKEEF